MIKRIFALLLCALLLCAFVACDDTPPTVPTVPEETTKGGVGVSGTTGSSSVPAENTSLWLNVATYNIVHCENQTDPGRGTSPDTIVEVIKASKLDICGLNEVV